MHSGRPVEVYEARLIVAALTEPPLEFGVSHRSARPLGTQFGSRSLRWPGSAQVESAAVGVEVFKSTDLEPDAKATTSSGCLVKYPITAIET